MASHSTNGQARANEKIVVAYKLKGDLPADYKAATLNLYLGVDVNDTTYLKVETGLTFDPSAVESTADVEGVIKVLENDVAGAMSIIQQTPEDAENVIAAFNNNSCDVLLIFCDPDLTVGGTEGAAVLTVQEGDRIAIVQNITPGMADKLADGTDYKIAVTLKKKIGATDRIAVFKTVLADI